MSAVSQSNHLGNASERQFVLYSLLQGTFRTTFALKSLVVCMQDKVEDSHCCVYSNPIVSIAKTDAMHHNDQSYIEFWL